MENNIILQWVFEHKIEIIASIISLIYLYFSIRQNILLWLFGILSSTLYIYVYYTSTFYADMSLQFYYVIISIYGWIHWHKAEDNTDRLTPQNGSIKLILLCILTGLVLWFILYYILNLTNSDVALGDAFTTAFGIVATWMLARKIIEHWLFWIVIDSVSLLLYMYKGLYATAGLFLVYTLAAILGYFSWKKDIKKHHNTTPIN